MPLPIGLILYRIGKSAKPKSLITLDKSHRPAAHLNGANHPAARLSGRFIRYTGLDEIPQLVNVLRGDMGLVGIRPVTEATLSKYETIASKDLFETWSYCYKRNPGLTGAGQIYSKQFPEHSAQILHKRMEIDVKAFEEATLTNDVRSLGQTPLAMLAATAKLLEF